MRRQFICMSLLFMLAATYGTAQQRTYSTFYHQRASLFEQLPVTSKDIVFLGNSITNGGEWSELFRNKHVKNRGISGDITWGVFDRLAPILKGKPAKIFLLIGINDVSRGTPADTIVNRIGLIIDKIQRESPNTNIYLQSILPVTDYYNMFGSHTVHWQLIPQINGKLKQLAAHMQVTYIDLYTHFADQTGKMDIRYTNDGVHLLGPGYLKWRDIVKPYI